MNLTRNEYKLIKTYQVKGKATKSQNFCRMSIFVMLVYMGWMLVKTKLRETEWNHILENLGLHVKQFREKEKWENFEKGMT